MPMPWERPDIPSAFTLDATTRRLGSCRWVELRLYEAMGGWVPSVPELDLRVAVGSACRAHAWHAELWSSAPAEPFDDGVAALMAAVAEARGTLERLVGAYRVVVPRLVAAYTAHANHTSAASDGPVARALGLALADEVAAWRDGELLVQSLVTDADVARRAAEHQARLEALIAPSGGLAGVQTLRPRAAARTGPGQPPANSAHTAAEERR
ncbi:MAG TPA: hypothetical protein VFA84_11225 [Acidimicrobiales bacterium]|nr:hypothetical protein [Acidimicrobiales bacterium]